MASIRVFERAGLTPFRGGVRLSPVEPLPNTKDRKFWTKGRRKAISSTTLTLFQVLLGGSVVGGVFGRMDFWSRLALALGLVSALIIGLVAAPEE